MKLGTLLLRDGVISLGQLETALRTQVLYGGLLGTNLVEIGALDLDTLGQYLAQLLDVPLATTELLDGVHPDLIAEFGTELADLYSAIPLGAVKGDLNAIGVAMSEPTNEAAVEQLSTLCGHRIIPYIAPQLRIVYYLEKHFGIDRKARYVRSGSRREVPSTFDERRRAQAPGGIEMPPTVRFEPSGRKRSDSSAPPAKPAAAPKHSFEDALSVIEASQHRNQIGDALIDYATGRFAAAALFMLRDANAIGWRVWSSRGNIMHDVLERVALPLGGASALQMAHDAGEAYRGGSPSVGRPVERRLWDALGGGEPTEMLVVPVVVKHRVVNLFYGHATEEFPLRDVVVRDVTALTEAAAAAYIRLIQETKGPESGG